MANTLEFAKIYQEQLDQQMVQTMLTGWMDSNSGQVKYNGGQEIKIPKMEVTGLGNYRRADGTRTAGYTKGAVKFEYETYKMTQDRATSFEIDAMDTDETNFTLTAGLIMGEFQRTQVVPEIDAYRISGLAKKAEAVAGDAQAKYGIDPSATGVSILKEIKTAISKIRDNGFTGQIMIHISAEAKLNLELEVVGHLQSITYSVGGINTTVPALDGCPLIETPSNRMYSAIVLKDGSTEFGYAKDPKGQTINFIAIAQQTPIAVTKLDTMRIFDPLTYQNSNSWAMDYRRYHDLFVMDNKVAGIYVCIKEAKVTALSASPIDEVSQLIENPKKK